MPTTENHMGLSWPSESVRDSPTFSTVTALLYQVTCNIAGDIL